MRTYRLEQFGGLEGLVLKEEPAPTPGAREVLVKVRATSINFRDLAILNGWYPFPAPLGRTPLSDAAGDVVAVGSAVTRFKLGDRVVNSYFPNWFGGPFSQMPEQYVIEHDGWSTDYKVVDAEALVAMPANLTYEEAACLPCAGVTAWSALHGVGPGDTVLTQGTGGVALFAVQLAKAAGARVIATTSSEEKAARLKDLGAEEVINYRSEPSWGDRVRDLTLGRGVDRIVEVGGPGTLHQSLRAVALGGQVSLIGVLAMDEPALPLDFMSLFMAQATLKPIATGSRGDLQDMIRVIAQHGIRPTIDRAFGFDDAKAAWAYFAERKLFGKVAITH